PAKYYSFSTNHSAIALASPSSTPTAAMLPLPLMIVYLSSGSEQYDPVLLVAGPASPHKYAPRHPAQLVSYTHAPDSAVSPSIGSSESADWSSPQSSNSASASSGRSNATL